MPVYTIEALVELLALAPHPEGGYFRETFRATKRVQGLGDGAHAGHSRAAGTAIYFLLPAETFSAWHRVWSDEVWHYYYDGAPLALHTIDPAGAHGAVMLGRDLARGERPQYVVPAGWLQAARPVVDAREEPSYALCGCTVSPGFEFADFEMPTRAELQRRFPQLGTVIDAFTHA
jgi:predicted cupin superfamily sugar epimerase